MEIAAYELLERLARRVGDPETAEVARSNRQGRGADGRRLADRWDVMLDLTRRVRNWRGVPVSYAARARRQSMLAISSCRARLSSPGGGTVRDGGARRGDRRGAFHDAGVPAEQSADGHLLRDQP